MPSKISDLENGDKNVDANNVDTANDDTSKRGHDARSEIYIFFSKYCEAHGFYSITYILFIYLVRFSNPFFYLNLGVFLTNLDSNYTLQNFLKQPLIIIFR